MLDLQIKRGDQQPDQHGRRLARAGEGGSGSSSRRPAHASCCHVGHVNSARGYAPELYFSGVDSSRPWNTWDRWRMVNLQVGHEEQMGEGATLGIS